MADQRQLEEQAANMALKIHEHDLDPEAAPEPNQLSSASAAHSLRHARAEDLPSYPVVGVSDPRMSANSAANLANRDHKDFKYWTPDQSSSANKAATLASHAKGPELWKAQQSQAGASAATLAAKKGVPEISAAGVLASQVPTGTNRSASMRAATGAMSSSRAPPPVQPKTEDYPDQANAASNALKAATTMAKRSQTTQPRGGLTSDSMPIEETGAHINASTIVPAAQQSANRDVAAAMGQTQDDNRQAVLRAASLSMAKRMYAEQTRKGDTTALSAARTVRGRASFDSDDGKTPITYGGGLEEAARKAATERLAKLHDEHAAYRTYYGAEQPVNRRTSMMGRRRAGSEDLSDEAQARKIREQNRSLFQDKLSLVDDKKRDSDRSALLAAAQRNVKKQMAALDDQHAMDTGHVPPSLLADWNAKAQATALENQKARNVNHGKVHIGGNTFMEQRDVDAIAAANVAPTLTEINEKAERHRQMEEDIRATELARKQESEAKRKEDALTKEDQRQQRDAEKLQAKVDKDEQKRRERGTKEELRKAHEDMKAHERAQKEEEKRLKAEKKDAERREKEELKRSKSLKKHDTKPAKGDEKTEAITKAHAEAEAQREKRNTETKPITGLEENTSIGKGIGGTDGIPPSGQDKPRLHDTIDDKDTAHEGKQKESVTEPITGLPMDRSLGSGEGGTDGLPLAGQEKHFAGDTIDDKDKELERKKRDSVTEPITGLGMDSTLGSGAGGTDGTLAGGIPKATTQSTPVSESATSPKETSTSGPTISKRESSLGFDQTGVDALRTGPAGAEKREATGYGHERRGSLTEVFTGAVVDGHQHHTEHKTTIGTTTAVDEVFASSSPSATKEVPVQAQSSGSTIGVASTSTGTEKTPHAESTGDATKLASPSATSQKAVVSPTSESESDKPHKGVRGWLKSKVEKIGHTNKNGKSASGVEDESTRPQSPPSLVVKEPDTPAVASTSEGSTSLRDLAMVGRQSSKPSSVVAIKDGHPGEVAPPHSTSTDVGTRDFAAAKAGRSPSISSEEAAAPKRGRSISPVSVEKAVTSPGEKFVDAPESQLFPAQSTSQQPEAGERTLSPKISNISSAGIKLERKGSGPSPVRDSKFHEEL